MDIPVTAAGAKRAALILYQRAKLREYQLNPSLWLVERFGGKYSDLKWSDWPEYNNHVWDGTKDPFLIAINSIKDGHDVGVEAATGVGKCLKPGTLCRMIDGSLKKIEDIKNGDLLLGL